MRKFGAQPLFPEAKPGLSGTSNYQLFEDKSLSTTEEQSPSGMATNKQSQQQPKRRMKAFASPRPLATSLQTNVSSSTNNETDFISNYALFLGNGDDNDEDEQPAPLLNSSSSSLSTNVTITRLLSSKPSKTRNLSSTVITAPKPTTTTRFGPSPLLTNPTVTNSNDDFTQMRQEQQKLSYFTSKRLQQQPFLPNTSSRLNNDEGQIDLQRKQQPILQTRSFQPSSRKITERRDSIEDNELQSTNLTFESKGRNQFSSLPEDSNNEKLSNLYNNGAYSDNIPAVHANNANAKAAEVSKSFVFDFSSNQQDTNNTDPNSPSISTSSIPNASEPRQIFEEVSKINRGKKLSAMIRLDRVGMEIFRMDEYDYEKYMGAIRVNNGVQASTQTFEDGMEESTQTEPEDTRIKWTQKPAGWFVTNNAMNIKTKSAQAEALGVGDDTVEFEYNKNSETNLIDNKNSVHEDREKLNKFLFKACPLMLAILSSQKELSLPTGQIGTKDTKSLVKLESSFTFLEGLDLHSLYTNGDLIACCHGPIPMPLEQRSKPIIQSQSTIVTIWTLKEPSVPLYFLRVWGTVTCIQINSEIFVATIGCKDGSIHFFNLKEDAYYHKQEENQTIRSASINTSLLNIENHNSPIMGLGILRETRNCAQIISMDKSEYLISWSLFLSINLIDEIEEFHQSQWSEMKLKLRIKINTLKLYSIEQMEMLNLNIWQSYSASLSIQNSTDVYFIIGTNCGFIGKGLIGSNMLTTTTAALNDRYNSGLVPGAIIKIISIDINLPFELFVSGCADGYCRIFTFSNNEEYALSLNCHDSPFKVRWSKRRACLIYVGFKNRIEFWDLLSSDVTPDKKINFECLDDFEILNTNVGEFVVALTPDGISVGSPPQKVMTLSTKDEARFKLYFKLITSNNGMIPIVKPKKPHSSRRRQSSAAKQ